MIILRRGAFYATRKIRQERIRLTERGLIEQVAPRIEELFQLPDGWVLRCLNDNLVGIENFLNDQSPGFFEDFNWWWQEYYEKLDLRVLTNRKKPQGLEPACRLQLIAIWWLTVEAKKAAFCAKPICSPVIVPVVAPKNSLWGDLWVRLREGRSPFG